MKFSEKHEKPEGHTAYRVLKIEDTRVFSTPEPTKVEDIVASAFPGKTGDFAVISHTGKVTLLSLESQTLVTATQFVPKDLFS
jgi:hypothetical protein